MPSTFVSAVDALVSTAGKLAGKRLSAEEKKQLLECDAQVFAHCKHYGVDLDSIAPPSVPGMAPLGFTRIPWTVPGIVLPGGRLDYHWRQAIRGLRAVAAIKDGQKPDNKTDKPQKKYRLMPENNKVKRLIRRLRTEIPKGRTRMEIAREDAENDTEAQNLLRQANRYKHLWHPGQMAGHSI